MFVFGSQYLRGLTPPRADWARDMATMRELGFNTVRAWLVWGVLEPKPGQIDLDYIREFLDLAAEHNLQVGLLFHLHGCPEWAIRQHREFWYVDEQGLPFESSPRANTPSGGWPGLCPDHAPVQELEAAFIERVVAEFGEHPALAFWEPINEPHMWVDLAKNPPGSFCYCDASRAAFRDWLHEKYGSLEALGEAWGRRLGEWDDVRPPTWRFGFTDWVDWRTFTSENVAHHVARRTEVMRRHTSKPIIGHAWGGGAVSCSALGAMAFDDWKNAAALDKWGYSAFPNTASATLMVGLGTDATRNAAAGKEFWQSELGAGDVGVGVDRHGRVRPEWLAMWCWESLRHGAQGLLFWQFRKEAHGSEFGGFGLTDYGGGVTENLRAVARIGKVLNDHAELFHSAAHPRPEVALLFSYQSFMTQWAQHRNCGLSVDALSGYYRMFWEEDIPVDVLHEEFLDELALRRYKMIVLPLPIALCQSAREALKTYVQSGGTLLSDPYLCAFDPDKALDVEVPGGGFTSVFGCRELDITSARNRAITLHFADGTATVVHGQSQAFWEVLDGAETVARYEDETPALIANNWGQGRAIMSGLNLGVSYSLQEGVGDDFLREAVRTHGADPKNIVLRLAREAGITSALRTPPDVRATLLQAPDAAILIAINFADEARTGNIEIAENVYTHGRELLSDEAVSLQGNSLPATFGAYESKVWRLE